MTERTLHPLTLPPDLLERAKRYTATRGLDNIYLCSLCQLVEAALREYLNKRDGENEQ